MIQAKTTRIPYEINLYCCDVNAINFILNLYPTKNLKFMDGPSGIELDVNGACNAQMIPSNYIPEALPLVDDSTISQLSEHVKAVLDECFESIGGKEIYLSHITLSLEGCEVWAFIAN